jgi:hypothetical protein
MMHRHVTDKPYQRVQRSTRKSSLEYNLRVHVLVVYLTDHSAREIDKTGLVVEARERYKVQWPRGVVIETGIKKQKICPLHT